MQFWAFVVDGFRQSMDSKIFWVLSAMSLVVVAALASIGFADGRVDFLFGLWEFETDYYNPLSQTGQLSILSLVVYGPTFMLLGWIGVILMIVATSGIFPRLMEPGAIDVLLAKPMTRSKLFLLKYFSSMVFVLLQATLFVGLTFLVMGFRWGVWAPRFLLSIPLLVLLFSYIYCVSVYVAVKTRSGVASILLCLAAWFVFAAPPSVLGLFETFPELKKHTQFHRAVQVAAWIPPKTAEIPYLAARWAGAGTSLDMLPPSVFQGGGASNRKQIAQARELEERELLKNPVYSIGSSLLFEGVVVLLAMFSFARKDF